MREKYSLQSPSTRLSLSRSRTGQKVHKVHRAVLSSCPQAVPSACTQARYIKMLADVVEYELARATDDDDPLMIIMTCCHVVKLPQLPRILSRHAAALPPPGPSVGGFVTPHHLPQATCSLITHTVGPCYWRVAEQIYQPGPPGGNRSPNMPDKRRHNPLLLKADSPVLLLSRSWSSTAIL